MKKRCLDRRGTGSGSGPALDKVDLLEKSLSLFRAEVEMKLKIMEEILTTRNGKSHRIDTDLIYIYYLLLHVHM
jgi:hypothetical protein